VVKFSRQSAATKGRASNKRSPRLIERLARTSRPLASTHLPTTVLSIAPLALSAPTCTEYHVKQSANCPTNLREKGWQSMVRPGFVNIVDGVVQMDGDAVAVGSSPHGGGIGVIAQRDIRAGEVILEEEAPLVAAQVKRRVKSVWKHAENGC
jgi:hypothetical protein